MKVWQAIISVPLSIFAIGGGVSLRSISVSLPFCTENREVLACETIRGAGTFLFLMGSFLAALLVLVPVGLTLLSRLADDIEGVPYGSHHRWGLWEIFVIRAKDHAK